MKREYRTPHRKHSQESNVIVTQPKTVRCDIYTLIKIGIDRRGLFHLCPNVFKKSSIAKQVKNWSGAYCTAART